MKQVNPEFVYDSLNNPRRVFTNPSAPVNDPTVYPFDNEEYNYILRVHDEITGPRNTYALFLGLLLNSSDISCLITWEQVLLVKW